MNKNDKTIEKFTKVENLKIDNDTENVFRMLEVTAITPVMYAVKVNGTLITKLITPVKQMLGFILSGDAADLLVSSNPNPRKLVPVTYHAKKLDGTTVDNVLGTSWFPENKQSGGINTDYSITLYAVDDSAVGKSIEGDLLSDFKAMAMDNNAINYWEIPSYYISSAQYRSGGYNPTSPVVAGCLTEITPIYESSSVGYTNNSYNNKARYSQSVRVTVYNPCSGARLEKSVADLLPSTALPSNTTHNLAYAITADLRPDGCPIFSWAYADGESVLDHGMQLIKGGSWKKVPLTASGLSGSYFNRLSKQNDIANTALLVGGALAAPVVGKIAGLAAEGMSETIQYAGQSYQPLAKVAKPGMTGIRNTLLGIQSASSRGIGPAIGGYALASIKQLQQQELLSAQGIAAEGPKFTADSDYGKDIGENKFHYYITEYDKEDMKDYDTFLEKYGYNVGNMVIGTQHFWSRDNFVYVRINDITIKSEKAGQELLDKVTDQLKAGVRIWRKAPTIAAMNPGGNRTVPTNLPRQ